MAAKGVNKAIIDLYVSGLSIPLVAERVAPSKSTVRLILKEAGVLRSRTEGVRLAEACGRIPHMANKGRKFSSEAKMRMRLAKLGKGLGLSLKPSGYIDVTMGVNKGRGQHRVIMERALGRALLGGEVVHHIDENRSNNKEDNLMVMTRSEHCRYHALKRGQARSECHLGGDL